MSCVVVFQNSIVFQQNGHKERFEHMNEHSTSTSTQDFLYYDVLVLIFANGKLSRYFRVPESRREYFHCSDSCTHPSLGFHNNMFLIISHHSLEITYLSSNVEKDNRLMELFLGSNFPDFIKTLSDH